MKLLRIASRGLGVLVVGAVIILGASFAPTLLGYESFIVTSGSMGKANPVGSVAVTRMVDARSIRTGDVVSFQTASESRITHRVIAVTEEAGQRVLKTQGDTNAAPDPEPLRLTTGEVAKVQWSVPYAGYLVRYARTPYGGIVLFVIPILGLIADRRKRPKLKAVDVPQAQLAPTSPSMSLSCPHCAGSMMITLSLDAQPAQLPVTINLDESSDPIEVPDRLPNSVQESETSASALVPLRRPIIRDQEWDFAELSSYDSETDRVWGHA